MSEVIFGYKRNADIWHPNIELRFAFYVLENGDVIIKKYLNDVKIIKTEKIIIPLAVVENIKKFLTEQKKLIDRLPKKIYSFTIDGCLDCFHFLGNKIYCWNPERIVGERYKELEFHLGELSPEMKEVVQQHNYLLAVFEYVFNLLKDYGLKVYSWEKLGCEWIV